MPVMIVNPIECIKVTKGYADFTAAGTTINIEALNLYPAGILHGIKVKHSVIFAGSGLSTCTLSLGIAGNLTKFTTAFSLASAVSSTNYQLTQLFASEDHVSSTSIRAAMTVAGLDLNQLTGGSVDIWLYYSKAR
jgi:hypothetical protein